MAENPTNDFGRFEMSPSGPFEAGSFATIVFRVTVGKAGLKAGGCVKVGTPHMGWGRPLCLTPHPWDELMVGLDRKHNPWKPINTKWKLNTSGKATIRLRADENVVSYIKYPFPLPETLTAKYGQWRWWITATVERDGLAEGDVVEIVYGDTEEEPFGVRVQPWVERNAPNYFAAFVDVEGKNEYHELPGSPVNVEVVAGPPETTVGVLPAIAHPGQNLPLRLNVLDRNLCPPRQPYKGRLSLGKTETAKLSATKARVGEALSVTPASRGVFRIRVEGEGLAPVKTNPVVVDEAAEENLYWGDLHAQSCYHQWKPAAKRGDSCNSPVELHAYARDCSMLDFVAITDGGGAHERSPGWEETQRAANECYEPGRYVSFKGWECGMGVQGDKCVVYRSADIEGYVPPMQPSEGAPTKSHALTKFYKNHKERVLTIPHSFMKYLDWSVLDPELDRVIEVYSCWGSYESRTDNPLNSKRRPKDQSAQYVWGSGRVLGVTAAGDSHVGYPGRSLPYSDRYWCQCFKAGLCAVYAKELTREAVWDALYDRHSYGTTGVRIVLRFHLNGARMGSVLEYAADDEALLRREIRVRVSGTDYIRRIDVLKNNELLHREIPESEDADFTCTDVLDTPPSTRDWYYVRVFQADGNAAWSSPIWVGPAGVDTPSQSSVE